MKEIKLFINAYTFAQKKFSMSDYLRKFKKFITKTYV